MPMAAEASDHAAPSPPLRLPATRQEVQAAIAKAVELRALHAALLQGGAPNARASRSPAIIRLPPPASPALSTTAAAAAAASDEDYPVFTPVYDEEPMAGLSHICQDNRSRSENWSGIAVDRGGDDAAVAAFSSSTSEVLFPSSDHIRSRGAYKIHPAFLQATPSAGGRFIASVGRVTGAADLLKAPATCTAFRPSTIGPDDSRAPPSNRQPPSAHSRARQRGPQILSWLFAKARKKARPAEIERENMSRLLSEWGLLSLESLRKELAEASAHRDAALQEAAEMRSSLGELTTKLTTVEAYCSELKRALRQATASSGGAPPQAHSRRSTRSIGASLELAMPVSHEAMVEGFLQIASEARLSVRQFCKTLIQQVEEPDNGLSDKLNMLLQPYQLVLAGKHCSKGVLHHLEALMNQSMFQDFESCSFQKNGSPKHLDPEQDRRESFASFVALRNLSWNEVLRKGTKYHSEDFSRFCDHKMSCVVSTLSWSWPWPEQLLQCFFVAAKCAWLLHLLAFSFSPPLPILRVEENRPFDQMYMEDVSLEKRQAMNPCRVKIMVMPGFYVQDRVLKCRVLTTATSD